MTISQLKEILRDNQQKLTGNKPELLKRIIKNISAEKYSARLPKIYKATKNGRRELETRWAYIENQREMYGFLNSEIAALEGTNTQEQLLEKLFVRDIIKHGAARDFGLLRNAYFNAHKFFKKRRRLKDSISALLAAIYFDLTGMSNNNTVESYSTMGYVFETSLWSELDKEFTALNLSTTELMLLFDDAVDAATKPPFSYFGVGTMKEMILARLSGQQDLLNRYEKHRNTPSENSPNYNYFDLSHPYNSAEGEEIIQKLAAGEISSKSGCSAFLIFLVAIFLINRYSF
ncbi:MAG: SAP domain-containing protein [Selenomonadaceae bacterium]|nr:SAP domain-containing protein [Selenomonadaceae bacterium]